jgi:hypothetical protein
LRCLAIIAASPDLQRARSSRIEPRSTTGTARGGSSEPRLCTSVCACGCAWVCERAHAQVCVRQAGPLRPRGRATEAMNAEEGRNLGPSWVDLDLRAPGRATEAPRPGPEAGPRLGALVQASTPTPLGRWRRCRSGSLDTLGQRVIGHGYSRKALGCTFQNTLPDMRAFGRGSDSSVPAFARSYMARHFCPTSSFFRSSSLRFSCSKPRSLVSYP